jgi:uncharacterized protein
MSELDDLVRTLLRHGGLSQKRDIQSVARGLSTPVPCAWLPDTPLIKNGDDTAAIPEGDGYLLLAAEGLQASFVAEDPWFAGFCSVMVNVSDIAAMGGRPYAVVDVVFTADDVDNQRLLDGMRAASVAYGVPIVGGHTGRSPSLTWLSVAILGRARKLLEADAARPGHDLIAAIDLRGTYRGRYPHFNAATCTSSADLRRQIAILPELAEAGRALACKDISQAGLAGTLVMLCESAGIGAELELAAIPRPPEVELARWLVSFPSYGYLLATDPHDSEHVLERFRAAGVSAARVGRFVEQPSIELLGAGQRARYWDLTTPLTGLGPVSLAGLGPVPPREAVREAS